MDVSHELGALRFVVDSPLSSKVAMFNQQVNQHKQAQLLNPFSNPDGRASPKPQFSKDEYGKPLAGSLTEMRGQKANMHVLKEMLELCQIIDSEGYDVKDEPSMRVIPFGELFNIYNYISDKVVGILLRARKHKLVDFEGEMLFQRRDDDVPIFLLKPIHEIRREMETKIESIKRCGSPAPQATSVLLDKKAHGLDVPTPRSSVSRTPSPQSSKAGTPTRDVKTKKPPAAPAAVKADAPAQVEAPATVKAETPAAAPAQVETSAPVKAETPAPVKTETPAPVEPSAPAAKETPKIQISEGSAEATKPEVVVENKPPETPNKPVEEVKAPMEVAQPQPTEVKEETKPVEEVVPQEPKPTELEVSINGVDTPTTATEIKTDVNNNNNNNLNNNDLPTIVIEATAIYEGPAKTVESSETANTNDNATTTLINNSESNVVVSSAPTETVASA